MPVSLRVWFDSPRSSAVDSYVHGKVIRSRYDCTHAPALPRKIASIRHERRSLLAKWTGKTESDVILARRLALARPFEERFLEFAQRWRKEVRTVSSTTERVLHPAYQDIIGMGSPILPLIFREMKESGGHWFWALRHITHANPVHPQDAGSIPKMTEAWLQWGREHHYL
jgi:hypothetical protein